ncbi:MAG: hypothetical protein ABW184_09770 [Sphingobium sp.]
MKRRLDWRLALLAVIALVLGYCWWNWDIWQRRAWMAAGFGARVACSCHKVEGRPLQSCRSDFAPLRGMELVHLSDSKDGQGVDASIPLLAHRTARLVPGFGCIIDNR